MGFLKPRPPPPEFQTTKASRPQHIEDIQPNGVDYNNSTNITSEIDDALVIAEGEDRMNPYTYLLAGAAGLS